MFIEKPPEGTVRKKTRDEESTQKRKRKTEGRRGQNLVFIGCL